MTRFHGDLIKKLRRIEIVTRRNVNELMAGNYHSVFRGQGIEFAETRPYFPGDDVKAIDWNVTARSNEAFVKEFVEERELNVFVAVDASASQRVGLGERTKQDMALEVAAILAFSALTNHDKVGLLIFSEDLDLVLPPRNSTNHVLHVLREIAAPRRVGQGTNLRLAMEHMSRLIKRRSIVFLISDFLGDISYERALTVLSRKHDLVALWMQDPAESNLPDLGLVRLVDVESGEDIMVDTSHAETRQRLNQRVAEHQNKVERVLTARGVSMLKLTTEKDPLTDLVAFFRRRAKQGTSTRGRR